MSHHLILWKSILTGFVTLLLVSQHAPISVGSGVGISIGPPGGIYTLVVDPVNPHILYAAPNGLLGGTCDSWGNACTLQHALSVAAGGDEIWVKAGVHYPGASGNRNAAFSLQNGVAVYGGFAGTETLRSERNWQVNLTILSGDIDGDDLNLDGNFIAETTADLQGNNAYHVVTASGNDHTAVLDGFVITAGQANGSNPQDLGGGMYNSNSSPTLANLIFSGNAAVFGGGIGNDHSSPQMSDIVFNGNAANWGGGMYNNNGSNPNLTNVSLRNNTATSGCGGGIANLSSNPALTNVTFDNNSASDSGGGVANLFGWPTLINVIFRGNSATNQGGGIQNMNSNPLLVNVVFSGNSAKIGGGIYNHFSNPTLANVSFSGNSASSMGGGLLNADSSSPTLINVILWGNLSPSGAEIRNYAPPSAPSNPIVTYSDVRGGYFGIGNINVDPHFVDADGVDNVFGTADDNLRLKQLSPCIDAGDNAAIPLGVTTDLDGKPRFVDIPNFPDKGSGTPPIVDIGAYEYSWWLLRLPLILRAP